MVKKPRTDLKGPGDRGKSSGKGTGKGPLIIPFSPKFQNFLLKAKANTLTGKPHRKDKALQIHKILPHELGREYKSLLSTIEENARLFNLANTELLTETSKGKHSDPAFVTDFTIKALKFRVDYRKARLKFFRWLEAHSDVLTSKKELERVSLKLKNEQKALDEELSEYDQWLTRAMLLRSPRKD